MRRVFSPEPPGPPAAECAAAGTGCLPPETLGCTGFAGSLLALFGNLWSVSEKVLSWPGSADLWSARWKNRQITHLTLTFSISLYYV